MDYDQARAHLSEVAAARRKAGELRHYRDAGSVVSAWGLVWLTGFSAQQVLPHIAPAVWFAGWIAALGWTLTRPRRSYDARAFATWLIAVVFIAAVLAIVRADERMAAMTFALALSAGYAALGLWTGKRFIALAAIVAASAGLGWWLFPQWLFGLLALGGGGALVLGGIWLRRP